MKRLFALLLTLVISVCLCASCIDVGEQTVTTAKTEPNTPHDVWTAHFLNVGKADCIILEADGLFYMIDTGYSTTTDILGEALDFYGITVLEAVFITHTDKDHIGGLKWLLKDSGAEVKTVYAPSVGIFDEDGKDSVDKKAEKQGHTVTRLDVGQTVQMGNGSIELEVLAPVVAANDENNNSLVMKLSGNCASALFMGDCEMQEEAFVINSDIDADLLKVAHHGSDKASSYSFLSKVSPQIAVISTSTEQREETPSATVLLNLDNLGAKVLVTQNYEKEITVTSDTDGSLKEIKIER